MKIGIDISQTAFEGTGVANYTKKLVESLLEIDKENEYVLFFSSFRKEVPNFKFQNPNKFQISNSKIQIKSLKIPPTLLEFLWNRLHICPIEWFVGKVDVFLSSDWTQPPSKKARLVTVVHDLSPWKYPETFSPKIVKVHRRRLKWVKKECELVICDCEATKRDLVEIIGINERKIRVVYPGI